MALIVVAVRLVLVLGKGRKDGISFGDREVACVRGMIQLGQVLLLVKEMIMKHGIFKIELPFIG